MVPIFFKNNKSKFTNLLTIVRFTYISIKGAALRNFATTKLPLNMMSEQLELKDKRILRVEGLSYRPSPDAVENIEQYCLSKIPMYIQRRFDIAQPMNENTKILHNITFEAKPGQITGFLSSFALCIFKK